MGSRDSRDASSWADRSALIRRIYAWYGAGFVLLVLALGWMEHLGLKREWIGILLLLATIGLYAVIGVICRTSDESEYFVAGRQVTALQNGLATAADWMSAASFIGLAGTLFLGGYASLAFVMGWTGGYCLVAFLIAPYLRKFGGYTIPEFLGARFNSGAVRILASLAAVACSFLYVVAQIYGAGLICARLTGVGFEIGIFLGLGGVLLCSFLGGMRAITWTQIAQYFVLMVAYLIPVVWLSVKQTGVPVPQLVYGTQLEKVSARERQLLDDPKERQVMEIYRRKVEEYSQKLADPRTAMIADRTAAAARLAQLESAGAPVADITLAEKHLRSLPRDEASAKQAWLRAKAQAEARAKPLAGMQPHAAQFDGNPHGDEAERKAFEVSRRNFLALVFCLTFGTAALPHLLTRYYTTPSVSQARTAVSWSLLFVALLYVTAPALAVLIKFEVFTTLVGTRFDSLPLWIAQWSKVDPGLISVADVNNDGVLQLGEITLGSDVIMLATPEIGGLPYVVAGLVAAGGMAAALSTADGLLLTIAAALSHDIYYKTMSPDAPPIRRVMISKVVLMVVAMAAAYTAAQRPGDIVFMVSAAFSLAAAAFFPVLVMGIFWPRANRWGALAGMVMGTSVTLLYMAIAHPWLHDLLGLRQPVQLWWDIQPVSAGLFGVLAGFLAVALGSWLTPPPNVSERLFTRQLHHSSS